MTEEVRGALRAARSVALGPAAAIGVYSIARYAFEAASRDDGLLKPGGTPDPGVAALGIAVLALRLGVLFALPPLLAYRIVGRLLERTGKAK